MVVHVFEPGRKIVLLCANLLLKVGVCIEGLKVDKESIKRVPVVLLCEGEVKGHHRVTLKEHL